MRVESTFSRAAVKRQGAPSTKVHAWRGLMLAPLVVALGATAGCGSGSATTAKAPASNDSDMAMVPNVSEMEMMPPEMTEMPLPLQPGAEVPQLEAAGWINGEPSGEMTGHVTVVDLWGKWCPYCDKTAPSLVKLYEKYSERRVRFVSLTSDPKETVSDFVKSHQIPWPAGFDAPRATVRAFGAYNPMPAAPEYEMIPTFYVIGNDGRVAFWDGQARSQHLEADVICQALSKAIDEALARVSTRPQGGSG